MKYTEIMVRYGELSTKGKNRKLFIDQLRRNVQRTLHKFECIKVRADRDRMHILLNGAPLEDVSKQLKQVFGIQSFSPVMKVEKDVEALKEAALKLMHDHYKEGQTFKIVTRRSDHQFELDTHAINETIGNLIFDHIPYAKVSMKQPDMTLRIEVRLDGIYLMNQIIKGAGGLPVGSSGKGMLMLSGGIDSPVAGYLAMKRGVKIEAVHFASPPYTSPKALDKAKDLAAKLAPYCGEITFIEVPFTAVQEAIKEKIPEGYLMTITRRMMMRIVDRLLQERHGLAIINGESLGQVASQTMHSMQAINDVTTTPVIRPVITMDKTEIIELAQKIDTFELAIQPFEDCCTVFAPPQPKTRPMVEKARDYEARLDIERLVEYAVTHINITKIHANDHFLNQTEEAFEDLL